MVPEYSKAALGLYPLIPLHAIDCEQYKSFCGKQGVQGFPTVRVSSILALLCFYQPNLTCVQVYPRGGLSEPHTFDGPERTGSAFYYWASRAVPHEVKKIYRVEDIPQWVTDVSPHV